MARSYEEILKELREKTKNATYIPVSQRNLVQKINRKNSATSLSNYPTNTTISLPIAKNNYENAAKNFRTQQDILSQNVQNQGIIVNKYSPSQLPTYNTVTDNRLNDWNLNRNYNSLNPVNSNQTNENYTQIKLPTNYENLKKYSAYQQTDEFKNQEENVLKSKDELGYAKYNYNLAKIEEEDPTFFDKSFGTLLRGFVNFADVGPKVRDGKGGYIELPSYNDLKQQQVQESFKDDFWGQLGKILNSATFEIGRIGSSTIANTVAPGMGSLTYFGSMLRDSVQSAENEGYSGKEALIYGTLSTALEIGTEKLLGGTTKAITGGKASALNQGIANGLSRIMNNRGVINLLSHAGSEATEEFIQEFADRALRNITLGENNEILSKEALSDAIYSAAVGGVTGIFGGIGDNSLNIQTKNELQTQKNNTLPSEITVEQLVEQDQSGLQPTENINLPTTMFQYNQSENENINKLNESMAKYFDNSKKTKDLSDTISKIIEDKDYSVIFDNTIKNKSGNLVNAQISTNNGKTEIKINPNSPRAVEFLMVHEITHNIETDSMKKLVMDYASKNAEFNQALENLKQTYGVDDVSSEVVADISGQLFGNQEFINNLSMEQPNIFKRIYNKIVELANKITGNSHEALFIRDLRNKWENAYRTQNNNNLNVTKYHVSENLSNEIDQVLNGTYKSNNQVKARDYTPQILVENGVSDLPMLITAKHIKSTIYSFDEAQKLGLPTDNVNYHALGKERLLNVIDSLDDPLEIYKTSKDNYLVITEILDDNGRNIVVPIKIDGKGTYNDVYIDENQIKSAYGRNNLERYIKNNNFEKIYTKKGTTLNERVQYPNIGNSIDNNITNSKENVKLPSTKYSMQENQNNTVDSQGRNLSKGQQEYFKDSKVRDENGNLKVLYHGTRNDFTVFDINKSGSSSKQAKAGFWFTESSEGARKFADSVWYGKNDTSRAMEVYLNIKKPKIYNDIDNSNKTKKVDNKIKQLEEKKKIFDNKYYIDYFSRNDNEFTKIVGMVNSKYSNYTDNDLLEIIKDMTFTKDSNQYLKDVKEYANISQQLNDLYRKKQNLALTDSYEQFRGDIYSLAGKDIYDANVGGTGVFLENENEIMQKYIDKLKKEGYDGIIIKNTLYDSQTLGEKNNQYVAFYPYQIKNVDNLNPTTNEDIRYSSNNQTWQQYLEDNYQATGTRTYMENIKLEEVPYVEDNNNLSEFENKELSILQNFPFELGEEEISRLNYLEAKKEGRIKFPELKNNITFEDIKEKYSKYKNLDKFDNSLLESAKSFVPGYRNTEKRTKNEWLQIANLIGTNFKGNSSQNLEKYAIQSWFASQPNQKDNLNRQGSKYVKFTIDEWVNEVYKGAGVGQLIDNKPNLPLNTNKNNNLEKTTSINLPTQQETKQQKVLNPNEIAQLTKEDANTTPILPTKNVEKGQGKSKFAKNIQDKTNMLTEESKQAITSDEDVNYYREVTNKESLDEAYKRLNKGGASETQRWFAQASDKSTSVDIAEGWILLKQYQDKIAKTNDLNEKNELNRSMVQVAKKMREMGTKAGQTVQAFNIMNRLTPEGMVYYAQSELDEAFNQMIKNKSKDWIDKYKEDFVLTPEETQFIMDTMQEISTMDDGYNKKVKLAEIQKLMTDKLPPERGAGIKSWMRISMLFNPKTQVRNVAGNAIIAPVNWFGDLVGSAIDTQIAKKTGVRTKGGSLKGYGKGFKEGLFQSYNDFKKGINTRNIEGNRFEISQGKSFNNKTLIGKSLNKVDSLLSFMLDAGDRAFYEAEFTRSINNQLVLNNTTQVTKDMVDIATNEALQRTWQDNNNYTKFVLNIRKGLNAINVKGYGLGDVLIPFAKTPANLTKALIDYSPAGLIPAINKGIKLKRSLVNGQYTPQIQNDFVNQLGKATAGTMLYVLGMALAKAGVTSGESDDDKDVANFLKNTLGVNSYSIKIGDTSFTYDWAQPLATPFAVTANFVQKQKENESLLENITNVLDTGLNVIFEQSFLSSINDVLSEPGQIGTKIVEQLTDLPARAIPTLSSQIANMLDSTSRTSFEYNKPLESMLNSIKYKIPFLTESLAPNVNTLGEEIERYGGANNLFNVFLNPANVNIENINESASEIYRLYQATGDKTIMPRVAPYYINQNGEKITLSSKEKAEYQTISGNIISESVEDLLDNQIYNSMSDTDKATIINKIVNYAYNKAREEVLDIPMANEYNKINMYVADGGNASEYYTNKEEIDYSYENPTKYSTIRQITTYQKYNSYKNEIDKIKDKYDNANERKYAVISYVNNLNLSIPQKAMLIKMNYSSFRDYDNQIIEYINSQDLTIQEKTGILTELGFTVRDGRVYK